MTGSVVRHPKEGKLISWGYSYRPAKDPATGKWLQVAKQGFKTKGEAGEALSRALAEAAKSTHDPRTFNDFFDAWITKHCERHCEPTTVEGYIKKGAYAKRIFGDVPLLKLKASQIESALNDLKDRGGEERASAQYLDGTRGCSGR